VKLGRFREDLFYRLHVFPITVPPLRDRPADVPALARHFLALFAAEEGKRIRLITPEALALLTAFHWPGNIRQLENAVFRAVVLAEGDGLGIGEFPQITAQFSGTPATDMHGAAGHGESAQPQEPDYAGEAVSLTGPFANVHLPAMPSLMPVDALVLLDAAGEVRPLEELEAELIRYAVTHYRGQMSEVARRLQIGRSTLYRKLEALGLNNAGAGEANETERDGVAAERQPQKIA
jgi:DNA-binding NtrC family response regulator